MPEDTSYTGWAVVELLGHRQYVGHVTPVTMYGTTMLEIRAFEFKHETREITERIHYHGPGALYGLTPITEEQARSMVAPSWLSPEPQLVGYRDPVYPADSDPDVPEDEERED